MSIQPRPDGGEFRQQDGQVLPAPGEGQRPHAEYRWDQRLEESTWTVRAAWRDGHPIDWPGNERYARYHEETGTILIASYGCIKTVLDADRASEGQRRVIRQFKEGMLDG